jgi:DNA-directed RNA polymerase II subunit RPB2
VFRELLDIIHAANPITILKEPLDAASRRYRYKTELYIGGDKASAKELGIAIASPTETLDGGKTIRRMLPNEARLRNQTYAATFLCDILVKLTFTTKDETTGAYTETVKELRFEGKEAFPLFQIPILLRSKLCATYGADKNLLFEMGECKNDAGGYFVVRGAEKVLIARQEQAYNSVYASIKPLTPSNHDVQTYADVTCQDPASKQTRRVVLVKYHESQRREEGVIRVAIPFVKGSIPLFCLFRALGVESDQEIIRLILPDETAGLNAAMEMALLPCIHDALPITSKYHAIEFIRTLTKGFMVEHVLDILQNNLFAHVHQEAKAQYLAELVRKMLRVEMNLEPSTHRDDIRNQRLLGTGALLRNLFADIYKVWKKAVILYVDKEYTSNRTLYQDDNFLQMFSDANISRVLSPEVIHEALMRGFGGKWGTNQYNMKVGVVQPLARISYLDAMSHARRVVLQFDTSMKQTGPRHLHPSQVGYFCTSETPTGGHIGVTKNMSMLTAISIVAPSNPVLEWLYTKGGVTRISAATPFVRAKATSVQLNGGTVGFSVSPIELTRVLKLFKWTACLAPTASVSFNTAENVLRIYLDDGRPLRPLWHLVDGKPPLQAREATLPSWRDLMCGTLPATAKHTQYSVEFVDPLAAKPNPSLEEYSAALAPHMGAIEFVDPYEGNEAYVSWWGGVDMTPQHTHAEIHPSTVTGLLTSMIPFANHNQSPRNQLSCSQSKQAIGYYATNYDSRFDTYASLLCYGEGPLARTLTYDTVASGEMPYGTNVIFAINSFNGYNQDDGILFNRSSIQRGLFRSLSLRSYSAAEEENPLDRTLTRVGNPKNVLAWVDMKPGRDFSALDDNGVVKEGTLIHDKTVLIGLYTTSLETGRVTDASVLPTVFTKGRVDKVVVLHQANGYRLIHVRILEERVPELGDKFSSRHGQKGTMGMLLDAQDMPRTADGMVPDVMVNPHCIPSRMTIAQLLEQVYGKLGAITGAKMNATTFMNNEDSFGAIADALESVGAQREGEEIMYSGITGKQFVSSVFMGPLYFMRLKHLTQDKLNARSAGRKEMLTHQPTGGRGNEGGMRIGEMERDSLLAHGGSAFLQESLMKRSDGTEMWLCNGCGTIPIFNELQGLFLCPMCDGPIKDNYTGKTADTLTLTLPVRQSRTTFSRVEIPYALKLMEQELTRGCYQIRFLTDKDARSFHEEEATARESSPATAAAATAAATAAAATAAATAAASAPKPKKVKVAKVSGPVAAALKMGASTGSTVAQETQDLALLSRAGQGVAPGSGQSSRSDDREGSQGTTVNIVIPGVSTGAMDTAAAATPVAGAAAPVAGAAAPVAGAATPVAGAAAPVASGAAAPGPSSGGLLGGLSSLASGVANVPSALVAALNAPVPAGLPPASSPAVPPAAAQPEGGPTLSIRETSQPATRTDSDVKIVNIT